MAPVRLASAAVLTCLASALMPSNHQAPLRPVIFAGNQEPIVPELNRSLRRPRSGDTKTITNAKIGLLGRVATALLPAKDPEDNEVPSELVPQPSAHERREQSRDNLIDRIC